MKDLLLGLLGLAPGDFNPNTGEIRNPTGNPYVQAHEERHKWQFEKIGPIHGNWILFTATIGVMLYPSLVSFVSLVWFPVFLLLLELDAMVMGVINMKEAIE